MDTQAQGPMPLVSDNDIAMVTANMPSRFLAKITTTLLRGWRDKYEAKLATLEQQLADEKAKRETTRECAEIMSKQLSEARELLAANGIYEDEGTDGNE